MAAPNVPERVTGPSSRQETVNRLFLEERFVDDDETLLPKAAVVPLENFYDADHLLLALGGFFLLSSEQQTCYVEALETIMETLGPARIQSLTSALFPGHATEDTLIKYFDTFLLLLEAAPRILVFFSRVLAQENPGIDLDRLRGVHAEFTADLLEILAKTFEVAPEKHAKDILKLTEAISDRLSTADNNHKLLLSLTPIVLHEDPQKSQFGFDLVTVICKNLSPEFVEGFVISSLVSVLTLPDPRKPLHRGVRLAAFHCFLRILEWVSVETFYDKVILLAEELLRQQDQEATVLFMEGAHRLAEKTKYDFVRSKIVPRFVEGLKSEAKYIRNVGLLNLHRILKKVLAQTTKVFNADVDILNLLFKYYFNLEHYASTLPETLRYAIAEENYRELGAIAAIHGPKLGPYLKYFFARLDDSSDKKMVILIKKAVAGCLGQVAQSVGRVFVEKELIFIVDQKFLTLGDKAPPEIKTLTIQNLARVLAMTAPTTRRIFADYYICLQDHVIKWRIRASICGQLPELMDLFEPADTLSFIVPMFFLLCRDEVAEVRRMAASHFHLLLRKIQTSIPEHVATISERMCLVAEDKKFSLRMVFVDLFSSLAVQAPGLVDQQMRQALQKLALDPVPNVRIKVALFVHGFFGRGLKNDFCDDLLAILAKDSVRDVQNLVQKATTARNEGKKLVRKG